MKPSYEAFISNLKKEIPLVEKVKLVLKNTLVKILNRRSCCGHSGEPGC